MKQNFVNEFHDNGLELEGFPEQKRNTCHLYGKINKFIIVRLWAWGLCDVTLEFNVRNFYKLRTDKTASRFSQLFHFFGTGLFRKLWMLIIVFFYAFRNRFFIEWRSFGVINISITTRIRSANPSIVDSLFSVPPRRKWNCELLIFTAQLIAPLHVINYQDVNCSEIRN